VIYHLFHITQHCVDQVLRVHLACKSAEVTNIETDRQMDFWDML